MALQGGALSTLQFLPRREIEKKRALSQLSLIDQTSHLHKQRSKTFSPVLSLKVTECVAESAIIQLWEKTLTQWDPSNKEMSLPVEKLVCDYNVPECIRFKVWYQLSDAHTFMKTAQQLDRSNTKNTYDKLLSSPNVPLCFQKIQQDVSRTFKSLQTQSDALMVAKLRRLLTAYAILDPAMGYCQGMNFIAAFILKQSQVYKQSRKDRRDSSNVGDKHSLNDTISMSANNETTDEQEQEQEQDESQKANNVRIGCSGKLDLSSIDEFEEQTFWLFALVLSKIRSLFTEGVPGFLVICDVFGKMCKKYLIPSLSKHLTQDLNIIPLLCHFWFHMLFTYDSTENDKANGNEETGRCAHSYEYLALRVWDVLIGAQHMDITFVLKIGLSILTFYENELLTMNSDEIMTFLKHIDLSKSNFILPSRNNKQSNSKKNSSTRRLSKSSSHIHYQTTDIGTNGFKHLDVEHCIRYAVQKIHLDQETTHQLRCL